jgi:hypothetical protein
MEALNSSRLRRIPHVEVERDNRERISLHQRISGGETEAGDLLPPIARGAIFACHFGVRLVVFQLIRKESSCVA